MSAPKPRELSPVEHRCAQFLCDITALGKDFEVLDAAPGMVGVPLVRYTLGQLFDRLAHPGDSKPVTERAELLALATELLIAQTGHSASIDESTVLGDILK